MKPTIFLLCSILTSLCFAKSVTYKCETHGTYNNLTVTLSESVPAVPMPVYDPVTGTTNYLAQEKTYRVKIQGEMPYIVVGPNGRADLLGRFHTISIDREEIFTHVGEAMVIAKVVGGLGKKNIDDHYITNNSHPEFLSYAVDGSDLNGFRCFRR